MIDINCIRLMQSIAEGKVDPVEGRRLLSICMCGPPPGCSPAEIAAVVEDLEGGRREVVRDGVVLDLGPILLVVFKCKPKGYWTCVKNAEPYTGGTQDVFAQVEEGLPPLPGQPRPI